MTLSSSSVSSFVLLLLLFISGPFLDAFERWLLLEFLLYGPALSLSNGWWPSHDSSSLSHFAQWVCSLLLPRFELLLVLLRFEPLLL